MFSKIIKKLFFALCVVVLCHCSSDSGGGGDDTPVIPEKSSKTTTDATNVGGVVNVMTYNVLNDKGQTGSRQWSTRRVSLVNLINRHNPDFIGVQEAFSHQAKYIKDQTSLSYFGYGTESGKSENNSPTPDEIVNSIFYNAERFDVLEKGVFWFSNDPDTPNVGFGEGTSDTHFRNCVWGKFKENVDNGEVVYIFNTHFSLNDNIRKQQASLLMSKVEEIIEEGESVAVVGDFNSDPNRDTSYNIMTNEIDPIHFIDTKSVSQTSPSGPSYTKTGMDVGPLTSGEKIDHVFTRNVTSCNAYKVIPDYEGNYYPSDHFPVLTVLSL
ncbi:endonuclease/exonuclease/phosphatase family protein [Flavivirga sp. 57AJ16]|uniref:endonuclease/exonuclease/phosphatase family protein n=1 Tax=Flavivirga sp. 57AJ16 TaxID=3025307 RepID=UPI002365375C|nr:endonuclease/exonuclease/phosphatase family protein [Flavivirga sp. 57AJ16]MDD7886267.1 endonuclease/exonuclease/phosphatase family protein [Flavivirga sp. 57AJ16]